jgi:fumarate reductase subunit C
MLPKNRKFAAYLDILEGLTGLGLAVFLHMHMIFVSSIHFGKEFFNNLTEFLDGNYLAHVGIPPVIILFFLHFLLAVRKVPVAYEDQRVIRKHIGLTKHVDTFMWWLQVISGMSILILGSIHFFTVLADWPISADTSIARATNPWFIGFYSILIILGLVHTYIGLYRLIVKWIGNFRKPAVIFFVVLLICTVALSFNSLCTFYNLK